MRKIALIVALAAGLAACDNPGALDAPAQLPLAPEVICEEPAPGDNGELQCNKVEAEVADDMNVTIDETGN